MTTQELRSEYRRHSVSPVEVARLHLDRIDQLNHRLNAFVTVTPERALRDARRAEAAFKTASEPPPLAGIPCAIKDLMPTRGIRTTRGSRLFEDWVPDYDPVIVQRLTNAGVILLGKTNTSEFGWKGDSGNPVFGPTRNPWCETLTAGGSSGGSAAAVAAGLCTIAQGGDSAGSIRIPASFCGVFGLKPSFGRVPYTTGTPATHLAHIGPITRSVADARSMLNVLSGPSSIDRYSLPKQLLEFHEDVSSLRLAWSPDLGYANVETEIVEASEQAAYSLRSIGCRVEEASPSANDPWPIIDVLFSLGQAMYADELEVIRDRVDPGRARLIERGQGWSARDIGRAMRERERYCSEIERFMRDYDVLLTPTVATRPFQAGADAPVAVNEAPTTYLGWTAFCYPFNLTGQPAATVPCGFTSEGLPIGLQIIGRYRADATVLAVAEAFESVRSWRASPPPHC